MASKVKLGLSALRSAGSRPTSERWARRVPLLVLIYEGVLAGLFEEYDFAPASVFHGMEIIALNVSREGADDLVDLQEVGMVLELRLASRDHTGVHAYQLSSKGRSFLSTSFSSHRQHSSGKAPSAEESGLLTVEERHAVDLFLTGWAKLRATEEQKEFARRIRDLLGPKPPLIPLTDVMQASVMRPFDVLYDDAARCFVLSGSAGSQRINSTVTHFEDVSYACSPHVPASLRRPPPQQQQQREQLERASTAGSDSRRPLAPPSQKEVAMVLSEGGDNLRDEDLGFFVHVGGVNVLFAEYYPFDSNEVNGLRIKAGNSRAFESLVSGEVDHAAGAGTTIEVRISEVAAVFALDSVKGRYVNLEAHVHLPEEEGILQLERFGVHCSARGDIIFGVKIDAVRGQVGYTAERVPVDLLSRVLIDLHEDSSAIMETLVSKSQRNLVHNLHAGANKKEAGGNGGSRNAYRFQQYTIMCAKTITPHLARAQDYLDGEQLQNDLAQVLGDLEDAFDVEDENGAGTATMVLRGSAGILLVSESYEQHEPALVRFGSAMARATALDAFFRRTCAMEDSLEETRSLITNFVGRTSDLQSIRARISDLCHESALLDALLLMIDRSDKQKQFLDDSARNGGERDDRAQSKLARALGTEEAIRDSRLCSEDLAAKMHSFTKDLAALQQNTDILSESAMFRLQESLRTNTRSLEELFRANESASSSLEILQVVIGGSLGFTLLDRLTGDFTVRESWWGEELFEQMVTGVPGLWFGLSLLMFVCIAFGLRCLMKRQLAESAAVLHIRLDLLARIQQTHMREFLEAKQALASSIEAGVDGHHYVKYCFTEAAAAWGGSPLHVEVLYDKEHLLLSNLSVRYNRRNGRMTEREITHALLQEMSEAHVFAADKRLEEYLSVIPSGKQETRSEAHVFAADKRVGEYLTPVIPSGKDAAGAASGLAVETGRAIAAATRRARKRVRAASP